MNYPKIIVALDNLDFDETINLSKKLNPNLCRLKVGMQLFTSHGPKIIEALQKLGFGIFLDLKYHDIPNQVANACIAAANLNVWMCTVHSLGGRAMLESAANAIANFKNKPKLVAVTIITSLNNNDCKDLGIKNDIETNVVNYTKLAINSGLDGVVSSALETKKIRELYDDKECILVTPGIRLNSQLANDQKRIVTPQIAIENGSSYLVMGRGITHSTNPAITLQYVSENIEERQSCLA